MHIDHSKLVELLVDASGLDASEVEEQLSELISEINTAIEEGDAYEVTGLGVFSGIGNNVIFIPDDELATEINYKYVGMEPIEMDEPASGEMQEPVEESAADDEDDPFGGMLDDEDETEEEPAKTSASFELDMGEEDETPLEDAESQDVEDFADEDAFEDPFEIAGQDVEDDIEEEVPTASDDEKEALEEKPGPDKWGIDSYKDDDDENRFSSLLGDQPAQESDEPEEEEGDDDFSSIFEDVEEAAGDEGDLAAALSKQLSDEPEEEDDDSLSSIFGDEDEDDEGADSNEPSEKEPEEETDEEDAFSPFSNDSDEEEELEEKTASEIEDDEDFDDPFDALAGEEEEDAFFQELDEDESEDDEEEVVPVITNLASEETKKKREETKEDSSKEKEPVATSDKKPAPVMLWVVLAIVVLAGGMYGLGYFGVVDIPGVTPEPKIAATQPAQQTQQPEQTATEPAEQEPEETPDPVNNQPEEQPQQTSVSGTEQTAPEGQPTYGISGVPVSEANDGYTIVIYSLSDEGNARAKQQELSNEGYRALLVSIPSQQYGQLWRVSLGQFQSLRTAALAAEELDSPFSENYFITKIQ